MMSSMNLNLRKLHRNLAPILFLPLLLSALTGVAYRVGRTWLGLPRRFGDIMMAIHEGRFLGRPLVPVYVLLMGLGLVALVVTGITLIKQRRKTSDVQSNPTPFDFRLLHSFLAPIFFLPLLVSASTGVAYRLSTAWFGLSGEQAGFLMDIHEGSYLGSLLRVVYVLLVGLGLLALLVTGIQMTGIFRSRSLRS